MRMRWALSAVFVYALVVSPAWGAGPAAAPKMGGILNARMFKSGYNERVAMYQPGIRYDKIMAAFGGHAENVELPEEIAPALRRAFAAGTSACINVRVDPAAIFPVPTAGRAGALMGY